MQPATRIYGPIEVPDALEVFQIRGFFSAIRKKTRYEAKKSITEGTDEAEGSNRARRIDTTVDGPKHEVVYGVHKDARAFPTFRVKLIGKRNVGLKRVYDLSVPNPDDEEFNNFSAAGIIVHNCNTCNQPFAGGKFHELDGKPYCEKDYLALSRPKCGGCGEHIKGDSINAMGAIWHPRCFVCKQCGKTFDGSSFWEMNGAPLCELHYHQQIGAICGGCGKAILGQCIKAYGKNWHPAHFVCSFCQLPLPNGAFTEKEGKPYCSPCYGRLFP